MIEKRADFVIGKSHTDDGSGAKAKAPPETINEILTADDTMLLKNKKMDRKTTIPELGQKDKAS